MLEGIDALVYDMQDVGARFYTYITTLGYCLEAAGKKGSSSTSSTGSIRLTAAEVGGPVLARTCVVCPLLSHAHSPWDDRRRTRRNVQSRKIT